MPDLRAAWTSFLDQQHRYPRGLVGRFVGEKMIRQHTPETRWTLDLLRLQPTDRVLELGFGAGRGLALAAKETQHGLVAGVDLSPTMIRAAQRRNAAAVQRGHLALLRGNVAALPFATQHFDKIWSVHTFYFWPDPPCIFADLLRILKPGGMLAVTFATARKLATNEYAFWPLQHKAEALVRELALHNVRSVALHNGPDSRQYNNVAIVIHK